MSRFLKIVAWVLAVPATIGSFAAFLVTILSWAGQLPPFKEQNRTFVMAFVFGMIAVALPSSALAQHLARGSMSRNFWKIALRGAPKPFRFAVYLSLAYAIVIWAVAMIRALATHGKYMPSDTLYVGAFALLFYVSALAISASVIALPSERLNPHCPNGHRVPAEAQFCATCGARILSNTSRDVS
jgi:hypothetical protein